MSDSDRDPGPGPSERRDVDHLAAALDGMTGRGRGSSGEEIPLARRAGPPPIPVVSIGGPPPVPAAAPAVHSTRFCTTCGTPWQAEWAACRSCATRKPLVALLTADDGVKSIKSAVLLYLTLLLICVISLFMGSPTDPLPTLFGTLIAMSAVVVIWALFDWREIVAALRTFPHIGWMGTAIGVSLITFGIGMFVIKGIQHLGHLEPEKMATPFFEKGYGWKMVILCVCVQPALIEELAFRGVVLGALRRALSPFEAILVSAMMFMILHLSPLRFPHTLALGLGTGYLRVRTKSLYPCFVLHFTHNFLCVAEEWAGG